MSENISSSKKFQVKRERGGDECALIKIKIRARTMAAAASSNAGWTSLVDLAWAVTAGDTRPPLRAFCTCVVCSCVFIKKLT